MLVRDVSLLPSLCFTCCDDVEICPCRCVGAMPILPMSILPSRCCFGSGNRIASGRPVHQPSFRGDGISACLRELVAIKHARSLAHWIVVGWMSHVTRPIGRSFAIKPRKKPELSRAVESNHRPSTPRQQTRQEKKRNKINDEPCTGQGRSPRRGAYPEA